MSKRHIITGSVWIVFLLAQIGMVLIFPARPVSAAGGNHIYVAPNIGGIHGCTEADPCSLAQGIATAVDGDTVLVAAGTYLVGTGFNIKVGITVIGPVVPAGSEPTAILDAEHLDRVAEIYASGKTVNLINLVIQNGQVTDENGAGIYCYSSTTLSLDHVIVRNNNLLRQAQNGRDGGGIYSSNCTLSINNSTISGNSSAGWGGGLSIRDGTASVNNTLITSNAIAGDHGYSGGGLSFSGAIGLFDKVTVSNNTSVNGGAGMFVNVTSTGSFTMQNSTVSGNTAENSGGGLLLYNAAKIVNSTFSNNQAASGGAVYLTGTTVGGITTNQGKLTLNHVTIADNSHSSVANIQFGAQGSQLIPRNSILSLPAGSAGKNCAGNVNIQSPDHNISSDISCWWLEIGGTDMFNTDALLGPLQDNGGPTQTRALLKGSPAINYSLDPGAGDPTQDQRGFLYNGRPDVGAFEVLEPPEIELFAQVMPPFRVGQETPLYVQILNPNGDPSIQTGLTFTLTLPQNLVFADPAVVPGSHTCGGTINVTPGERTATLSNGINTFYSPVTECHLSLAVRAVVVGNCAVTATGVSSKETWTGAPPDPLNFSIAPLMIYLPLIKVP
jgi:predicted outer membrane repeat protein